MLGTMHTFQFLSLPLHAAHQTLIEVPVLYSKPGPQKP